MRGSNKRVPSRIKKLAAAIALAGASLFTSGAASTAQDVLPPSIIECETCDDGGLGGWNLYWHDPYACNSSCHCLMGDWTCPTAAAPRLFASVEFLPLIRDQLSPVIFAARATQAIAVTSSTSGTGDAAVVTTTTTTTTNRFADLTEDDFSNAFDPGMRLSLGIALNDQLRLEGSYIGNYSWTGSAQTQLLGATGDDVGNLLSPFSHFGDTFGRNGLPTLIGTEVVTKIGANPPSAPVTTQSGFQATPGVDYNTLVNVDYASQFSMGEINLRRRISNISTPRVAAEASLLLGFRVLSLSEQLAYTSSSTAPPVDGVEQETYENSVIARTNNRLLGPQIGFQTQFLVSQRTWIDFDAKGAMLFGTANTGIEASFPATPTMAGDLNRESENITAFLGDLALRYNYQFTQNLTLNAGYNAFFLDGVALASKQLNQDANTLLNGTPQPDHTGRIVYHGPSLGLVFAR